MPPNRPFRIALLSPRGPLYRHRSGIWKKSLRYMPLTLTTLAALVPAELNAEISLIDEGIDTIDPQLDADLIGISAITGTAPRSYELAAGFRQRGIPVVLGGVHPTLLPDEAARHADAVVVGYAEQTWPQLLRDFVAGRMADRYVQAPDFSLAGTPPPRRDLLPSGRYTTQHTIEATRGCIHQCEFCVVPTAWGRPIQRPIAEVIADIKAMGARRLVFLDLNLIADLTYAKALFSALAELRITWAGLATTLIAHDEELLDLAARAGCRGLLIGLESASPAVLRATRKGFNDRLDYRELTRRLHDRKIALMGCFVFGFDHDDQHTFAQTVELVQEARIDLPRYAIQTPFPATPLYRRLEAEGRILTTDWSLYDGQHVVYQPARLSPAELLQGTEWAWKHTYRYRSIANRISASPHLGLAMATNLGYRFYAYHLNRFYTCDAPLVGAA